LHADVVEAGWKVTEKTVADSMRRQGLVARIVKRRRGLTRQDKIAPKFADLVKRDFTAAAPNTKWCGGITEIPTGVRQALLITYVESDGGLDRHRPSPAPRSERPCSA